MRFASLLRARPLALSAASALTLGTAASITGASPRTIVSPLSSIAMLEAAPAPFARIVSYNVLSSHLCEPEHFLTCAKEDLAPPKRLERLKDALVVQMESDSVICLQEVSVQWVGELTPFFEKHGYTFVSGNYGAPFNGYMGVSLAWPRKRFEAEDVEIVRVADTKKWPKLPKPPPPSRIVKVWRSVKSLFVTPPKPPFDTQHETKRRHNMLVSAKLKCKKSGDAFCVSTYHMPCLFGSDPKVQVMTYHAALAAQQVRKFADGLPCVLAGDFNFMPGTAPYRLVTDGVLPPDEPHLPPMPEQDSWQPTVPQPFESAYVASGAGEPEFTNLATTQFMPNEPFIGTLDYIFLSSGDWAVTSVKPLKKIDSVLPVCKSYPNADEPSDHVCIWADVELKPKK